jgi:hypothetical protein
MYLKRSLLHINIRYAIALCYCTVKMYYLLIINFVGHAVAQLVEVLCYKPIGRGFDFQLCH